MFWQRFMKLKFRIYAHMLFFFYYYYNLFTFFFVCHLSLPVVRRRWKNPFWQSSSIACVPAEFFLGSRPELNFTVNYIVIRFISAKPRNCWTNDSSKCQFHFPDSYAIVYENRLLFRNIAKLKFVLIIKQQQVIYVVVITLYITIETTISITYLHSW